LARHAVGAAAPALHPPRLRDLASAITAGVVSPTTVADELDAIASAVAELHDAAHRASEAGEQRARDAEAREVEYTALLDEVARAMATLLENAELPVHVLLTSPFGTLNENQEEMLTAAHQALDVADADVRRFRALLALDRGATVVTRHPVGVTELLEPGLAIARARARAAHVTLAVDLPPTLPRVVVDATQVQAALTALLVDAVAHTVPGGDVRVISLEGKSGQLGLIIEHAAWVTGSAARTLELRLAQRSIAAQRGTLSRTATETVIELPSESLTSVRP